ncbi:MAG: hypothetical protein IJN69_01600 [Oscillospiraceae bacterium]|nr:hypothetical protein [Oscillospiraceae bacterium]
MKDLSFKGYIKRVLMVVVGLALSAYGIGMTIYADLGLAPWDVFNQGVSIQLQRHFGINIMMGTVSQITCGFIIIIVLLLKEPIGISTILDTILFGGFLNFFMKHNLLPSTGIYAARFVLLGVGFVIWAIGVYLYMQPQLGAGPRDSLMIAFAKRGVSVGIARNSTEFFALAVGWLCGGKVGIGTIISVFFIGYILQFVFKLVKFDATKIKNESLIESGKNIFKMV